MTTNKTTDALLPCCAYCDKQMDIEETPSKIHDGVVIYRACCVNDDCVMDLSETKGYERLTDLKSALKTRAQPKPAQCPLGEDCDLTIAYMKGFSDGKADRPKPAQGMGAVALEELDGLIFSDGAGPVCAWVNKHQRTIRAALTDQRAVDVEGTTPSSQKGGCDYMSFQDAQRLFSKYINCEMRDPSGINDTAKAMLAYWRMVDRIARNNNITEKKK